MSTMNKLLNLWDTLKLPQFLISVNIEPTNHCQLHCGSCYRDRSRPRGYMTWETFESILDQIYDIPTISTISLNGAGESTLHPRFFDMVEELTNKKNKLGRRYKTGFSTNGNNSIVKYLDLVDTINISLDGVREVHERYRTGSDWTKVDDNINELFNHPRSRTKISANLVKSTQTEKDILDFNTYCKDIGFDGYTITNYHDKDMRLISSGNQKLNNYSSCRQRSHTAMILWNGDITTCCADLNGVNIFGNKLSAKRSPGPLCKLCNYWMIDEVGN